MKASTTISKRLIVFGFWILVWQTGSVLINSPILLASPLEVAGELVNMIQSASFWLTIGNSFFRIILGFILGLMIGLFLAILSYKLSFAYDLFSPLLSLIKSIPVASFIILLLIWVDTEYLSTVIGFLMVLPVVYENIYRGLSVIDKGMLEMSWVFNVPLKKRFRYLYFLHLYPYLLTAVSVGLGFGFKSGVAAEVIGICRYTIGEAIYTAKIHLETAQVMAWTVVIVVLATVTEGIAKKLLALAKKENSND